jgi:hypothetical protein
MPEFKLISADSHVNEPRRMGTRAKEYGERAPKAVKDPWCPQRICFTTASARRSIPLFEGTSKGKDKGISEVQQEKHFETIRFNEQLRHRIISAVGSPPPAQRPGSRRHRG